jgi:hypothetical protein
MNAPIVDLAAYRQRRSDLHPDMSKSSAVLFAEMRAELDRNVDLAHMATEHLIALAKELDGVA